MKKCVIFTALLIFALIFSTYTHAGTWVDNWFDNATTVTTGGPGMIHSSSRDYYSAGYGSIRWQTSVDYPISIGMPQVRFGCGGVDIFLGSMDLMNFDYLVSRLKNIMYSAGAFAFQYALSRLNPKANQILQALDSTANFLNNLQLDECRAGKAIAMKIMSPFSPEAASDLGTQKALLEQVLGIEGSWEEVKKKWEQALGSGKTSSTATQTDINRALAGCPAELTTIANDRYFLEHLAKKGLILSNFVPLVRGLLGDIYVDSKSGHTFYVEPCPQKVWGIVQAVSSGDIQKCSSVSNMKCSCSNFTEGKDLKTKVRGYLAQYLNNLYTGKRPGKNDKSVTFMNALIYYPVYTLMKMAYQTGVNAALITTNSRLVECATQFYAAGLLTNALSQAQRLSKMIDEWKAACSKSPDIGRCLYCKSDRFKEMQNAVNRFVKKAEEHLYNNLDYIQMAKRSDACMSLEKSVTLLGKLSRIEQRYSLSVPGGTK